MKGALKVKQQFGADALLIFIMPPSIEALRQRLVKRGTDTPEVIAERIGKAEYEISFAKEFDKGIVNDDLPVAVAATESAISDFIRK